MLWSWFCPRLKADSLKRLSPSFSLAFLLLCTPAVVFSQQRWERNYGGTQYDLGESVQQTSDGGYIVAGYTTSFGNGYQVYLIKTNASGDSLWTRNYGGDSTDYSNSVQQTQDGGYIIAGYTSSFGNGWQVYLIKTNASGDTLWTKAYSGGTGRSVRQTSDGGYIVAGYTGFTLNHQVYLIKTNGAGDTLWTRTFGGDDDDEGYSVQQTSDGGYIIAGITWSFGNMSQVFLVKTNASGDTLWTRNYGGFAREYGYSVQQTSDTGYIVAGFFSTYNPSGVYLIKTTASGDTLWTRTYGFAYGHSVQQTTDGGYIVAGASSSFGDSMQVYLIKTDASGNTLWTRTYGGAGSDWGFSMQQTTDGGYIVAGGTTSFGNGEQVYLIKTDANGNVGVEASQESHVTSYGVFPNPFSSFSSVPGHSSERFALYDISGRKVGVFKGDRVGEGLVPGVYFLKPEGKETKPLRIVKLR